MADKTAIKVWQTGREVQEMLQDLVERHGLPVEDTAGPMARFDSALAQMNLTHDITPSSNSANTAEIKKALARLTASISVALADEGGKILSSHGIDLSILERDLSLARGVLANE